MYRPPPYLGPALWISSWLFQGTAACRNRLYSAGLLPTHRLSSPVLSVGNITTGGTGKTPLVLHIAGIVARLGSTPVLLSRGYGGRAAVRPRVVPPGPDDSGLALDIGDEPALVRRRCPEMWLAVDPDRYRGARAVEGRCPRPVFIMDDGFQHRRLHRDFDIVVVDATQPLETNRLLPRGSLREPQSSLRRADAVVLNSGTIPAGVMRWIAPGAMLFTCRQSIRSVVSFRAWALHETEAPRIDSEFPFFLVAGIGNPERFRSDTLGAGIHVRGARFFRDHHRLSTSEWDACRVEAIKAGAAALLTTEKDAVKIDRAPDFPVFVAVQATCVVDPSGFEATIEKFLRTKA